MRNQANQQQDEVAAERLRVLAHPQRLRILRFLAEDQGAPVHHIEDALGLSQSTTSTHLAQLKRAGFVGSTRQGKEIWYDIEDPCCLKVLQCIRRRS